MPAGEWAPPISDLAYHFPHLAPDLHTVRRHNVGAGRGIDRDADNDPLAALLRLLIRRTWSHPATGDAQPVRVIPVRHHVAIPVGNQRRPKPGHRLTRCERDHHEYTGVVSIVNARPRRPGANSAIS